MASSYFNAGVLSLFLILSVQKPTNANRLIQVIDMDQRQSLTPAQAAAISRIPVLEQQVERNTAGTEEVALLKQSIEDMKADILHQTGEMVLFKQSIEDIKADMHNKTGEMALIKQSIENIKADILNQTGVMALFQQSIENIKADLLNQTGEVSLLKQSIEDMNIAISRIPILKQQLEQNTQGLYTLADIMVDLENKTAQNAADIANQTGEVTLLKQSIEDINAGLSQCAVGTYTVKVNFRDERLPRTKMIPYGRTFARTPKVVASVAGFYYRLDLQVDARSPNTTHFDLYLDGENYNGIKWVYSFGVSWMACP